jgi:hypothetical protein
MKKIATTGLIIVGVIFLAGCGQQQTVQTKSITTELKTTEQPVQIETIQPTPETQTLLQQTSIQQQSDKANSEVIDCTKRDRIYFKVKELGVKFLVDKSIKDDLVYEYNKPKQDKDSFRGDLGGVVFSTKSLTDIDPDCSAYWGTMGTMGKTKGKPVDYADGQGLDRSLAALLVKQFDDFFIGFRGPEATCGKGINIQKTTDLANQLRAKIFPKCMVLLN